MQEKQLDNIMELSNVDPAVQCRRLLPTDNRAECATIIPAKWLEHKYSYIFKMLFLSDTFC